MLFKKNPTKIRSGPEAKLPDPKHPKAFGADSNPNPHLMQSFIRDHCKFTDTAPKQPRETKSENADPGTNLASEALILHWAKANLWV